MQPRIGDRRWSLPPQIGDRRTGRPRAVDPNSGAEGGGVPKAWTSERPRWGNSSEARRLWNQGSAACTARKRGLRRANEGPESPPPCAGRRGGMPPGRVLESRSTAAQGEQGGAVQLGSERAGRSCDDDGARRAGLRTELTAPQTTRRHSRRRASRQRRCVRDHRSKSMCSGAVSCFKMTFQPA